MSKYNMWFIVYLAMFMLMINKGNCDSLDTSVTRFGRNELLEKALEYTGFGEFSGYKQYAKIQSELITISEDNTPFLHARINNKPIWKISFYNVSLKEKKFCIDTAGGDSRTFDIFLDPETGQLLQIDSKCERLDTSIALGPSAERAEQQLTINGEQYLDFAQGPSKINFRAALDSCMFGAFSAKK